jgi:hypothetical protein
VGFDEDFHGRRNWPGSRGVGLRLRAGAGRKEEGKQGEKWFHGWWLVAGEVVDFCYPAWREFGRFAVEDPIPELVDGVMTFWAVSWGEAFPVFSKLVVFCWVKMACSFAASVSAARAQPPLVMPLSAAKRFISSNVELSTEVLIITESLPGLLVFLAIKSISKIFQDYQFFCLTLKRILLRNLPSGVIAPLHT